MSIVCRHLQIVSYIDERSTLDNLRREFTHTLVAALGRLKSNQVSMDLRDNKTLFQNFTIKHLYIHMM